MQTFKQDIVKCTPQQLDAVFNLWGMDSLGKKKLQSRLELLQQRIKDPIAARFVWQALSPDERVVLFYIVNPSRRGGARIDLTLKKSELPQKTFEKVIASLKEKLLLWEDTVKLRNDRYLSGNKKTTTYEDVHLLHPYNESVDALYATGRELFSEKGDRSILSLDDILAQYQQGKLLEIATKYYDYAYQGYYFSIAAIRELIREQLSQPTGAYEVMARLKPESRDLFKWVCEQGGKVSIDALGERTGSDSERLYAALQTFEEAAIAFDTFSDGQRVLFVPPDVFQSLKQAATEAISAPAPAELVILSEPPRAVQDSMTTMLFDLAIVTGAAFQQVIEPTQAGNVPKRLATKIQPLLHGKPRMVSYENENRYLEMAFDIAMELGILRLSNPQLDGIKPRYEAAPSYNQWASLDVAGQTRGLLENWTKSTHWIDILGLNFKQSDLYSFYWKPVRGREVILAHLKQCVPGRWYSIQSLLNVIWENNPFDVRETSYSRQFDKRKTSSQRLKWMGAEGELYTGMINSSLSEMGIVQTGYTQPGLPDDQHPRNPDAFMITPLGAAALALPMPDGASTESALPISGANNARPLVLQPNFEILVLHFDPPTLYGLLPFAQVQQVDVVSRFALTRASVLHGMEWGLDIEQMLALLERSSQKDIPQNVAYTLRDWGKLFKDARVSQVFMLELSSEAIADDLLATSKFKSYELRKVAPRVLVAPGTINIQSLRTAIEKEGVTVRLNGEIITAKNRYSMASAGTPR